MRSRLSLTSSWACGRSPGVRVAAVGACPVRGARVAVVGAWPVLVGFVRMPWGRGRSPGLRVATVGRGRTPCPRVAAVGAAVTPFLKSTHCQSVSN